MGSSFTSKQQFKAEETGIFVYPLIGQGEVVSIYSAAINILRPARLIVSVVENSSQMTALGLRLPELFRSFESQGATVQPGDKVRFERSRMVLNDLSIELEEGTLWEGSLAPDDMEGFSLYKIPLLQEALLKTGKKGGLLRLIQSEDKGNPFVQKASRVLDQIVIKGQDPLLIKGFSQLVGLGVGFTPSGDDFIAGVLLGERMAEHLTTKQEPIRPCAIDKGEIWRAQHKTNDGGRTLLWQALQGHFPHYLIEAARGLAGGDGFEEIMGVVGHAVGHGETSGTDALVGLFSYLAWMANLQGMSANDQVLDGITGIIL